MTTNVKFNVDTYEKELNIKNDIIKNIVISLLNQDVEKRIDSNQALKLINDRFLN
jgi:hypothetical protein